MNGERMQRCKAIAFALMVALSFTLEPTTAAEPVEGGRPAIGAVGFNIAKEALGGKISSFSSQYNDSTWAAARLIDGFEVLFDDSNQDRCTYSCGWKPARGAAEPQEITFSFYNSQRAHLRAVVLHPSTELNTAEKTDGVPEDVEIWVSDSSSDSSYRKLVAQKLDPSVVAQTIELPDGSYARFLKLRLLSAYGAQQVSLGEVEIIEHPHHSILTGLERDLARVENGGTLVWFTSQSHSHEAAYTVWPNGRHSKNHWRSSSGAFGKAKNLPQEFVYAFNDDRIALIDRVEIDVDDKAVQEDDQRASLAKTVAVEASLTSPLDGFEEIGRFELNARGQPQSFPLDRRARFLKLRILSTQGPSDIVTLGTVRIIEGNSPDAASVLYQQIRPSIDSVPQEQDPSVNKLTVQALETEPNDSQLQANPLVLKHWTGGSIDPLGEQDFYKIVIDSASPTVLTTHVRGFPQIRSSLSLGQANGEIIYRSGAEIAARDEETISLQVDPGEVYLQISRPTDSYVLVWDTSGSMDGSTKELESAVFGFIDRVQPSERLQLIRFSQSVETLLPEFSGDVEMLRAAAAGKFNPFGATNLYKAITSALDQLKSEQGNRAVILLTDGQNSVPQMSHETFWRRLAEDHVPVYTIGLGPDLHQYNAGFGSDGGRFLRHLAMATNGLAFRANTANDLGQIYESIAQAVRKPSHYQIQPTLSSGPGLLEITSEGPFLNAATASDFEVILDVSGSMASRRKLVQGKQKIEVARSTLREFIEFLPDTAEVGLRFFGHRIREYEAGDCQDTELVHSISRVNRNVMYRALDSVHAEAGTTPLAYSLVQAATDLIGREGRRMLILITDGEEYCGADPVKVAKAVQDMGFPIRIEVVGLALGGGEVERNMRSLAHISGGRYYRADDAQSLSRALREAIGWWYEVHDAAGKAIASGRIDEDLLQLPEGQYTVLFKQKDQSISVKKVKIKAHHVTRVQLQQEGRDTRSTISPPTPAQKESWNRSKAASLTEYQQEDKPSVEQQRLIRQQLNKLQKEVTDAVANRPRPQL